MVCLYFCSICWECLSSHITLTGPLIFSGLFQGYFLSDDFPEHFIYTLISSLSILHFKRQKGEMKLPSFPGFCFLPSLITLPCTEYFPCLFVSATGIKATCIPLAHVAAHTLPSSSGLFPCSLCFTYGGLSTHSFYFLFYFTLQYCIGIAVH